MAVTSGCASERRVALPMTAVVAAYPRTLRKSRTPDVKEPAGVLNSPARAVSARFDDMRDDPVPLELQDPYRVMLASKAEEVRNVIDQAEWEARSGGWVAGFVTYEAAPGFDDALKVSKSRPGLPLVWFAAFRRAVPKPLGQRHGDCLVSLRPEVSEPEYGCQVAKIHQLITAGETYQTNYTLRLRGRVEGDPGSLYADLSNAQRGGYHALLSTGDHTVVSASPELFFRWDGHRIETRPMKGTIARGRWEREDRRRRERLASSTKDQAENVMIVDLVRNDLGRLARFGTVEVERLFDIERFETVWQMTSTVLAETRTDVRLVDVFAAMFPCGSVTGAPKARTMEIIASLETSPRGVYCGAIGLLAPPGSGRPRAEFSVAIRTLVIDEGDRSAEYGVGGGVVHESSAADEYREAMVKARVLDTRREPVTLLETMRWEPGSGVWLLERHLDRLRSSARYFGVPVPEEEIERLLEGVGGGRPLRVRLLVPQTGHPAVELFPLPVGSPVVGLAVDTQPVDRMDVLRYHKTTRRRAYQEAAARHPAADDVVLVNDLGEVVETTTANLAVRIADEWLTPPVEAGCLPGTYRAELIDLGVLRERRVAVADLIETEEIAVINSVRGWRPAKLLDGG